MLQIFNMQVITLPGSFEPAIKFEVCLPLEAIQHVEEHNINEAISIEIREEINYYLKNRKNKETK